MYVCVCVCVCERESVRVSVFVNVCVSDTLLHCVARTSCLGSGGR